MSQCAEVIARKFWSAYAKLALAHGVGLLLALPAWDDLPENRRSAMVAAAENLLEQGVVVCGEHRMERT